MQTIIKIDNSVFKRMTCDQAGTIISIRLKALNWQKGQIWLGKKVDLTNLKEFIHIEGEGKTSLAIVEVTRQIRAI